MNNKPFALPNHIVRLDQAMNEGLANAIPLIVKQVDEERTDIIIDQLENLLRKRESEGYNTNHLDGIRLSIQVVKGTYNA
jgi:hypothetical protein